MDQKLNSKKQPGIKEQNQQEHDQLIPDIEAGEVVEWRTKYLRALADYQNLEKRTQNERQNIEKYAGAKILTQLLPIVDSFESAQVHLGDEGLGLAIKQLNVFFESNGVTPLDVIGKQFNPETMECTEVVKGEEGKVIEVVAKGYLFNKKVLRVAKVKVGKTNTPSGNIKS